MFPRHLERIRRKHDSINTDAFDLKLKVSRSRNMKQKIYEILTSPKIQTNGVILNQRFIREG